MNIDAAIAADFGAVLRARQMHPDRASAPMIAHRRRPGSAAWRELLQLYLPRKYGGEEVEPATFVAVVEELAKADASTAWCVAQASERSLAAAYLDPMLLATSSGSLMRSSPGGGSARKQKR